MLAETDIEAFAENLFQQYGPMADVQALKRASSLSAMGDAENSRIWYEILDRVREMQNRTASGRAA